MKQLDLSAVHETFPLLRFACDEAGERNYKNLRHWHEFLYFRDQQIGVSQRLSSLCYVSANEPWYQFLDELQGDYGFVAHHRDGSPVLSAELFIDPMDKFSSALESWRTEWLRSIEKFVPPEYQEKITEDDGAVSFTEDPWELFHYSKPRSGDLEMDRYRRWLARRDWFLTNLAMLLRVYRKQFNTAGISQWFDEYLTVNGSFHENASLGGLLTRQLHWEGRNIPIYCNWSKKSLGSLLFKVLRKQYGDDKTLWGNIFDIVRGRFVVANQADLEAVVRFIKEYFPNMPLTVLRDNPSSSSDWKALYFKGWTHGIKFELQVQLINDYLAASRGHSEVSHPAYEMRKMLSLMEIMLPPPMLERFFGISWEKFCAEYVLYNKERFRILE
ncbi:MAG TPA: hypothetical protein PL066_03065 [bacterium]|nr:hypothetical protein [bacterium]